MTKKTRKRVTQEAAQYLPKGCSREMPPSFLHFNTLFSNTSALTNSLLFWAKSTCKGSRTPRLVEHFWVPILGASCSNKVFVGTLRPPSYQKVTENEKKVTEKCPKQKVSGLPPFAHPLLRHVERVGQLFLSNSTYKILPWRFRAVFSPTKSTYKLCWLEVDHGLPTFDTNISVLKLQGSFLQ